LHSKLLSSLVGCLTNNTVNSLVLGNIVGVVSTPRSLGFIPQVEPEIYFQDYSLFNFMQDFKKIVDKSEFLAFKNFISLEKAFSRKAKLEKIKF